MGKLSSPAASPPPPPPSHPWLAAVSHLALRSLILAPFNLDFPLCPSCCLCFLPPWNCEIKRKRIANSILSHVSPCLIFLFLAQAAFKCTMLTSEKSPQSLEPQDEGLVMWNEATFEEKCTYIVKDQPLEEESENNSKTRAERSLPRNLALKRCHNSGEVCMLRVQLYETKRVDLLFSLFMLSQQEEAMPVD